MKRSPRLGVSTLPREWGRMPDRLILSIEDDIRAFRQALLQAQQFDYRVEDFLDEILIYARASFIDVESVDELLEETQTHYPEDAWVLGPVLEQLGKSLLRELHLCGAYTSDGLLHWRMGGWVTPYVPYLVPDIVLR